MPDHGRPVDRDRRQGQYTGEPISGSPVLDLNETVYAASEGGHLRAFHTEDLRPKWAASACPNRCASCFTSSRHTQARRSVDDRGLRDRTEPRSCAAQRTCGAARECCRPASPALARKSFQAGTFFDVRSAPAFRVATLPARCGPALPRALETTMNRCGKNPAWIAPAALALAYGLGASGHLGLIDLDAVILLVDTIMSYNALKTSR